MDGVEVVGPVSGDVEARGAWGGVHEDGPSVRLAEGGKAGE